MGSWGTGLYQDDFASDLKNTIALVSKVPADGDRLLAILRELHADADLDGDDGPTFWLVVADQFERKGVVSRTVSERALAVIDDDQDLDRLRDLGLDARGLAARRKVLEELASRLRAPRPSRPVPKAGKPPAMVVAPGEIYAFPTMKGKAVNAWFDSWEAAGFVPDGWGALVVVETGRAFDWLPWCAVASLSVDAQKEPTLKDALGARLLTHPQTDGAARCVPKAAHLTRMRATRLGTVALDPAVAAAAVSRWSVKSAIGCGWSIASAAFASTMPSLPMGVPLRELLAESR